MQLTNHCQMQAFMQPSPLCHLWKREKNSIYFDGVVSDGTSHLRLVGFTTEQQKKLSTLLEAKQPAYLTNCELKRNRQGDKMEIILKKFTTIGKSPKKIDLPADEVTVDSPELITLDQLPDIQPFQRVSIDIKAVFVCEPLQVTGGKKKQDIIIADRYTTARLTIW